MSHSSHIYIGPYFVCEHDDNFLKTDCEIITCVNKGCSNFNCQLFGSGKYCDRCGQKKEKTIVKKHDDKTEITSRLFKIPEHKFPFRCINKQIEKDWRNRSHIWVLIDYYNYVYGGANKEIFGDQVFESLKEAENSEAHIALQNFYGKENVELKYGLWYWEEYNHEYC